MSFLLRLYRGSFALLAVIVFIGPQIVPAQADTEAELSAAEARVETLVGTIHAEFEWHPGGGAAADPYPQLNEVC